MRSKNIALLYSSRESIALAPVYDMLAITVYDDYAKNPPGMPAEGCSTWMPGKALERFLQARCGVMPAQTRERVAGKDRPLAASGKSMMAAEPI